MTSRTITAFAVVALLAALATADESPPQECDARQSLWYGAQQ